MHILSYANKVDGSFLALSESARENHGHFIRVGENLVWGGWIHRIEEYYKVLLTLPSNDMALLVDGYDVLVLRDLRDLERKWINNNVTLYFPSEHPHPSKIYSISIPAIQNFRRAHGPVLNMGVIGGRVDILCNLYDNLIKHHQETGENDDETLLNDWFYRQGSDRPDGVYIDNKGEDVFCNMSRNLPLFVYTSIRGVTDPGENICIGNNKEIGYRVYGDIVYPYIVHGINNSDLRQVTRYRGWTEPQLGKTSQPLYGQSIRTTRITIGILITVLFLFLLLAQEYLVLLYVVIIILAGCFLSHVMYLQAYKVESCFE